MRLSSKPPRPTATCRSPIGGVLGFPLEGSIAGTNMVKRREFLVGVFTVALAGQIAMAASAADNSASGMYAELPGVKLWFTDTGGAGVPIMLLHANTGTSAVWTDQVTRFSQAGYRVIAFDRRGWGKSIANPATGPQPGSIAGDLDALADYLKLTNFICLASPAADLPL